MPGKGRPPQAIPSPISRHIITCYVRYQGSKHTAIYILVQTIMSVQAKLEVVRRKHIVHRILGIMVLSSDQKERGLERNELLTSLKYSLFLFFIMSVIVFLIFLFFFP